MSRRRWLAGALGALCAALLLPPRCMLAMPGRTHTGSLAPLSGDEERLAAALREHVTALAGTIGERNTRSPARLEAAAAYVEGALGTLGYDVAREAYAAGGDTVANLVTELPGRDDAAPIVVVGAHYDSAPGTPGANDNASGVAALIELARLLAGPERRRTIRFVAFVNEEPPWFQTQAMGSLVHATRAAEDGVVVEAMLSLETLGYYSEAPRSQRYPAPFSWFYPHTGDFVAFVGNLRSRRLTRRVVGTFRDNAAFPSEGAAVPALVRGVGWSDHWAFWQTSVPAVMVTDTAPFRYPHYHRRTDTPDRVDTDRLARVVAGLVTVVDDLADR